jgi:rRNA maturation protein Nop10
VSRFVVDPAGNIREEDTNAVARHAGAAGAESTDSRSGHPGQQLRDYFEACPKCGGKTSYKFTLNPFASKNTFAFWMRSAVVLMGGVALGGWYLPASIAFVALCSLYYLYRQTCDACGSAGFQQRSREGQDANVRTAVKLGFKLFH